MKVLMIIDGLRGGGKERQLLELTKGLSFRKDAQIEIATMNKVVFYEEFYNLGIKIHFLIRKIKFDLSTFFRLYQICQKFKPDIIHTWDTMTSLYITPIARLLNIKLVIGSIRSAPGHINFFSLPWLIKLITFPFVDKIVSNSYAGLLSYKVKKNGICIHNGFDLTRIKYLEDKNIVKRRFGINTEKVIGMVASFSDNKDYETYISAAMMILKNRTDVTFLTIGDGINLEKSKIKAHGYEKIKFLGIQNNIESIVNVFNAGVLSTYTEGMPNSIMEYMALGKPVIATVGGGTKELVINGETGFLVQAKSPDEVAYKIEYLLNNPEIAEEMGAEGKERITTEFNTEKMTSAYYDLYSKLS